MKAISKQDYELIKDEMLKYLKKHGSKWYIAHSEDHIAYTDYIVEICEENISRFIYISLNKI